jgi:hypothetical protein
MKIIEIEEGEQPGGEPGIYVVKGTKLWGVAPMASGDAKDMECIPYQWARDFPELEGFVARFPLHWKVNELLECWVGGIFEAGAIYWCRWTPPEEKTS